MRCLNWFLWARTVGGHPNLLLLGTSDTNPPLDHKNNRLYRKWRGSCALLFSFWPRPITFASCFHFCDVWLERFQKMARSVTLRATSWRVASSQQQSAGRSLLPLLTRGWIERLVSFYSVVWNILICRKWRKQIVFNFNNCVYLNVVLNTSAHLK
jgi:hypothetical protein